MKIDYNNIQIRDITSFAKPDVKENRGAVRSKQWLKWAKKRALFKPDTAIRESRIEFQAGLIAKTIGIPAAEIAIVKYCGDVGTLSLDVHTQPGIKYRHLRKISKEAIYE